MTAVLLVLSAVPALAIHTLVKSQEWVATGDTVANGVYAADVDGDGTVDILTIGTVHTGSGASAATQAQLRIWNWNGLTLTLKKSKEFTLGDSPATYPTEYGLGVFAGALDGDADVEIVTVGYAVDTSNMNHDHLAIWTWDGTTLTRHIDLGRASPATMRAVYGYDFDGTYMEIVTVGEDGSNGDVLVFNWSGGGTITGVDSKTWTGTSVAARSVYIENIKNTGSAKQILIGYSKGSGSSRYGHVLVYDFSNGALSSALSDTQFQLSNGHSTEVFSVFADYFYGSTTREVGACGSYDNSGSPFAGVQFLLWSSGTLGTAVKHTWQPSGTANECRGLFAADLTSSSGDEIVAAGYAVISGTENGELHTFNYDGSSISNQETSHWVTTSDTRAHGVFIKDVDADSTKDILTVGQAKDSHGTLNAQLRIWHLS